MGVVSTSAAHSVGVGAAMFESVRADIDTANLAAESESEDLDGMWTGNKMSKAKEAKEYRADMMVTPIGPGSVGQTAGHFEEEMEAEDVFRLDVAEDEDGNETDEEEEQNEHNRMHGAPMVHNATPGKRN